MNPFRKSPSPLRPSLKRDQLRWVCPEEAWNRLSEYVQGDVNAVILGVEGSGKTTLLNFFFSPEYCARAAEDGKLIFFADLSDTDSGDRLCGYLTDQLRKAAGKYLPEECCALLQKSLEASAQSRKNEKLTFIDACETLYEGGYTMLLVMDGFERFVSSPQITQSQHEMLRGLLDKDVMRCIVATNYDLEQSSLPADVAGSLYLQKFQDKLTLQGFTEEETRHFADTRLTGSGVEFNDRQLRFLRELCGGTPALLELGMSFLYEEVEKTGSVSPRQLRRQLYDAARPTLGRWCKFFTPEYERLVESVVSRLGDAPGLLQFGIPSSDNESTAASARLCDRGLWVSRQQNVCAFNSGLLQNYFQYGDFTPSREASAPEPAPQAAPPVQYIFNGPTTIEIGTTNVTNQNFSPILATRDLLGLLTGSEDTREGFARSLYAHMTRQLPQGGLGVPRLPGMTDAEYDAQYDSAFTQQLSDKVVDTLAVDEDEELVEVSQEEQLTLERRFREARAVTREAVTDELLGQLSPRTAFYLKLSVVVEDALSILKLLHTQQTIDCSAQLILYGKAVEQQLKDSFYPLFHREETLRQYTIRDDEAGWISFGQVSQERTSIGNYMHALGDQAGYLSQLCADRGITRGGGTLTPGQWNSFWTELRWKINEARKLRNLSAHTNPGDCPVWEDVDRIAELCFGLGQDSVLRCCTVGGDLNIALFGCGELGLTEGKALEGTEAVLRVTRVKPNGGMDGMLEGNQCLAKVSPSKAKKYRQQHPEEELTAQTRCRVRLTEYREQDGALYFAADLLGLAE